VRHLLLTRRVGLPHSCPQMPVPSQLHILSVASGFFVLPSLPFFSFLHIFPPACHPCWQMVPYAGPDAGATRGVVLSPPSHFPAPPPGPLLREGWWVAGKGPEELAGVLPCSRQGGGKGVLVAGSVEYRLQEATLVRSDGSVSWPSSCDP